MWLWRRGAGRSSSALVYICSHNINLPEQTTSPRNPRRERTNPAISRDNSGECASNDRHRGTRHQKLTRRTASLKPRAMVSARRIAAPIHRSLFQGAPSAKASEEHYWSHPCERWVRRPMLLPRKPLRAPAVRMATTEAKRRNGSPQRPNGLRSGEVRAACRCPKRQFYSGGTDKLEPSSMTCRHFVRELMTTCRPSPR